MCEIIVETCIFAYQCEEYRAGNCFYKCDTAPQLAEQKASRGAYPRRLISVVKMLYLKDFSRKIQAFIQPGEKRVGTQGLPNMTIAAELCWEEDSRNSTYNSKLMKVVISSR
ncbi:hypothetical protein PoB_002534700 [Plakobranchus ocellatus]|uniref:Uncharacterized protein n=1 Tax=Plakobranchus ocellatus TaxID=259542 RepID=A0AAV3ZW84_9GAST|nr:hypothetical protein PoB_002534700 [Plakobranchus ocellatus]